MPALSAGVLVVRRMGEGLDVLLGHMGGPFWTRKEEGAWTIPKGLVEPGEPPEVAARREFLEETGLQPPQALQPLTPVTASGKRLLIWLAEADLDLSAFTSNLFELEWPPRSGRTITAPELDRISYHPPADARRLIVKAQRRVLEEALGRFGGGALRVVVPSK